MMTVTVEMMMMTMMKMMMKTRRKILPVNLPRAILMQRMLTLNLALLKVQPVIL